jgi:hypothetical protein
VPDFSNPTGILYLAQPLGDLSSVKGQEEIGITNPNLNSSSCSSKRCTSLAPRALAKSMAHNKAATSPDNTVWPGELALAMVTTSPKATQHIAYHNPCPMYL